MLVRTKGLVVKTVNYGESSIVATIYTQALGMRTYMLKGVRSSRGKQKGNIYQIMQFLDIVVIERENKNLQYIREAKSDILFRKIPYDIRKTAIGLFMLELISISVKEMEANDELYHFIENYYKKLDSIESGFSDYHLQFMLDFTRLMGFFPLNNYTEQNSLFALQDGQFVSFDDEYPNCLSQKESLLLHQFLKQESQFSKEARKTILDILDRYYQFHVAEYRSFKTPSVFEDVFG